MTAAPPLPSSPAVQSGLRDFPDRLSPMLVKELRQGLKSHLFTWGLIAMQLALIIMTLIAMDEGNSRDINSFFWWSVAGPVCLLLPLRVANALRDESSGNTLDTLLLTHLSAWRITLGKWLATCALQVLVAMTALPYLILRYFAGGVNMPLEVAWLGVYILFGLLTTAVMLGLSWFPHFLIRSIFMLAVLAGAAGFCGGTIDEISRAYDYGLDSIYREVRWPGVVYGLTLLMWVVFFFLDLAAARLAPMSENRATRRRLVALAVLVIAGSCSFATFPDKDVGPVMAVMLGMGMMLPAVQALCERPANLAPVLLPFLKRGLPGRLAGRLLYPGWHTGVLFTVLVLSLAAGLAAYQFIRLEEYYRTSSSTYGYSYRSGPDAEDIAVMLFAVVGVLGTILMPLVIWVSTRRMKRWDFWRWLLLVIAAGAFHFFIMVLGLRIAPRAQFANYALPSGGFFVWPAARTQANDEWEAAQVPENYVKMSKQEQRSFHERRTDEREALRDRLLMEHSVVAGISLILWIGAACWMACREMRVTRRAEQELA